MVKLKSETAILIVFISIAALLVVGYNIFSMEMQKKKAIRQLEEEARLEEERQRLEEEMLEELKSRETVELAEYYKDYKPIKAEFTGKAAELSEEAQGEIGNVAQLKELAGERLEAAKNYREKIQR